MKRLFTFSGAKFKSLPLSQQHKKCCEILHEIYKSFLIKSFQANTLLHHYLELAQWMGLNTDASLTIENIADLFHWHARQALILIKEDHLLPPLKQRDRLEHATDLDVHIFLDGIRTAHNIGSIFRTTEAFRLGKIYLSSSMCSVTNGQIMRAAMGTVDWISYQENASLQDLPHPIIALETCTEAISYDQFIFPKRFTLVVGNEEYGCSSTSMALANYIINIPLYGRKNSLNVANAFAIVAAKISQQIRSDHTSKTIS